MDITLLTYVLTGFGGFVGLWVIQNSKLKEGMTDHFLSMLGKFGSKKIPLRSHRAFIIIKNYENQLNLFLFNNHTKSLFYKEFVGIIFKNIVNMADKIVTKHDKKEKDIEYVIADEIENCKAAIDKDVFKKLIVPKSIENKIDHWKSLMIESIRISVQSLVNDDMNNSNYFKVYRTLDIFLTFTNFITGTGSILFNNINGAFDHLEAHQIYKHEIVNIPNKIDEK